MENKSNIFRIIDVSKKIKGIHVINHISLNLHENEIFGLLGLNGAGKTTIIKIIAGLLKSTTGNIEFMGNEIGKDFENYINNVGISFDTPGFYNFLTGYKNLEFLCPYYGIKGKNTIQEIVHTLKLEEIINKKVSDYSMGMKQKLNIAQAVINHPKLLILDEPTNGLDPKAIKELRTFLLDYKKRYNAIIFISSHNLSEIENICDRIGIIHRGRLLKIYNLNKNDTPSQMGNGTLEEIFLRDIERDENSYE